MSCDFSDFLNYTKIYTYVYILIKIVFLQRIAQKTNEKHHSYVCKTP